MVTQNKLLMTLGLDKMTETYQPNGGNHYDNIEEQ